MNEKLSKFWFHIALTVTSRLQRFIRRTSGSNGDTLPGRILLRLVPDSLERLSANKSTVLVSGTNGKTSTVAFLTQIMTSLGEVTSNFSGSNLDWGVATALMSHSSHAVLEVDELHLPQVMAATNPKVVLLLNLTRDQLHRMHEVKRVAERWRAICEKSDSTTFVVDVDDPFLNYATETACNVRKISFGGRMHSDASACPSCGKYLNWNSGIYDCSCGLSNKKADQTFPNGPPGYRNATLANIVGEIVGAEPVEFEEEKMNRSFVEQIGSYTANIRLAKNPASWAEALRDTDSTNVLIILNARQVDGLDTSWLWDISFKALKGRKVVVCGERGIDMALRLHVEEIEATLTPTFRLAMSEFVPGSEITILASYTAFYALEKK